MSTVRGAVLRAVGARPFAASRPLQVTTFTAQEPRAGEIAVDIVYSSLCHSDLSVVDGTRVRPLPMALGHEAVGRVTALGAGVTDLAVGDRVVLVFVPSCGTCRSCTRGRPALCSAAAAANGSGDLLHGPGVYADASGPIHHHLGVSAFADRAVVARESAVRLADDAVPDEVAALFGCAVLTGMGAVLRSGAARDGDHVVVYGLGAVGLAAVMAARIAGAATIVAVDPNPDKHAAALASGATHVATPDQVPDLVAELTGGEGADLVIEAVGAVPVLEAGLAIAGRGGAVVAVGLPHPDTVLTTAALPFAGAGKRLIGSYMGDAVPSEDIPRYAAWWREGRLPLEVLHTDTVPLADINEALDALAQGRVIRRLFRA